MPLEMHTYLFFGAGQTALGCASLLVTALAAEGLTEKEARARIWMISETRCMCLGGVRVLYIDGHIWMMESK